MNLDRRFPSLTSENRPFIIAIAFSSYNVWNAYMPDNKESSSFDSNQSEESAFVLDSLLALEFPPPDFGKLKDEYYRLWAQMIINPTKLTQIDNYVDRIVKHHTRYESVSAVTSVPWYTIALIHCLECDLDFSTHLHNGDPLTGRTHHVPAGRPAGDPPFAWETSAVDALNYDKISGPHEWSVAGIGYLLEGYNGWGYQLFHPDINNPYLWSFSNQYTSGKYVEDGSFSSKAVSDQCGAMVLLRRMVDRQLIALPAVKLS
jgi:lysozyme family protein